MLDLFNIQFICIMYLHLTFKLMILFLIFINIQCRVLPLLEEHHVNAAIEQYEYIYDEDPIALSPHLHSMRKFISDKLISRRN